MRLDKLLAPRSIAIVGASDKVGPGFNAWNALTAVGFTGETHFVNPKRDTLFGRPCYPSISAIPGEIDAAFLAVPAAHVLSVATEAADKGAGGLAVMSSGFGEAGAEGEAAQAALATLAAERGLAVCGPNCLGFLNFSAGTALFGTSLPDAPQAGDIAAIVQSGSIGIALLNSARGLGFSHLITSGNEAVTTVADYMAPLVDDPGVSVILVFVEELRQPRRFLAEVRRARAVGKPVVVLKSGRTAKGQSAVLAHTGAVAGDIATFDAALAEAGAIAVHSLDELIETALVFSALRGPLKAKGAAMVSLSGGEIALALDAGEEAGLDLPAFTSAAGPLAELLPPYSHIANPLDLTWVGLYEPTVAAACVTAIAAQDDIGLLVLLQDAPEGLGAQQVARYSRLLDHVAEGAAAAGLPLVALSNISGGIHPDYAAAAARHGVPTLRGTREGMAALAARLAFAPTPVPAPLASDPAEMGEAQRRLAALPAGKVVDEVRGREILAAYGVPGLAETVADDAASAVAAAEAIGYPVVLKALVGDVAHKSEHGLVALGLADRGAVERAAAMLLERAAALAPGARLVVQEMVRPVGELLVGARVDPAFGPVVVVGGGGTEVELYRDVAIRLAPLDVAAARAMIEETRVAKTLAGWRGRPVGDLEAAAAAVAALSRFVADFAGEVSEVEINPLAVLPLGEGCRALDCLIARR